MTDKWFKVIKITSAVLSLGAAILTDYVGSKTQDEQIKKEVMKAVADMTKKNSP